MGKLLHIDQLSEKVKSKFRSLVFNTDDCILWNGNKTKQGYGKQVFCSNKKYHTYLAHRVSFILFKGSILEDLLVCHSCDNPSCINPKHLFLGTHYDNIKDCVLKGRRNSHFSKENQEKGKQVAASLKRAKSKLSFEDVLFIRHQHKQGITMYALAKKFDVHFNSIRDIVLLKNRING